ncbi:MAG: amidophosphoribosyltransferase [SAR324 cluster bacterium]|nr:amidophosphoribosyltransferase [SAR324 cluster bacterium]
MCGIIGLFLKNPDKKERLGVYFEPMLVAMSQRGPDSAGFAVYRNPAGENRQKFSLYHFNSEFDWPEIGESLDREFHDTTLHLLGNYGILCSSADSKTLTAWLDKAAPGVKIMGMGSEMEIYKDVGSPQEIATKYKLQSMQGTCLIGHTRMATESAVNVEGSHPYTTGKDLCLVHNGSYANHNSIRRAMADEGIKFDSWNDTEVAAGYVRWRLEMGEELKEVLAGMIKDFSGFFTLVIGLKGQFAVMRDSFACKPMVVAETEEYVACASEFRALAHLPGVNNANLFEPQPEEIYVWSH